MTEEQLKPIYQLYTSLWQMFKTYSTLTEGSTTREHDEHWKKCTDEAERLVALHGEDARPLVLDTLELIENTYKASIKGKSQYQLDKPIYRKEQV